MPDNTETFIDTNVLIYLMSSDEIKATRAEQIMEGWRCNQHPGIKRVHQRCAAQTLNVVGRNP